MLYCVKAAIKRRCPGLCFLLNRLVIFAFDIVFELGHRMPEFGCAVN